MTDNRPAGNQPEDVNDLAPDRMMQTRVYASGGAAIPIAREGSETPTAPTGGNYIGPYRVERRLSSGGMGEVLLAWDDALRRRVALKLMDSKLLTDGDAMKRFEREARAAAAIQHPNIAQIYLVGLSEEGLPFLAMEYIDGGSLMDAIRTRKPLSYSQVAAIMEQVASALQAGSKVNVIHRDIKPANIMLTRDLEARVVDFGLAKIFFEDSYRTIEGMVLGTPSYMAPEQGQGRVVDLRADIYSFGATFYHVITGRLPFNAETPVQIMMKHVSAPLIPMRSINPQVPIEFDEIIGRCMRKDLDERYQDYEALLVDIKRVRLMCLSREQGALIGGDGRTSGSHEIASSLIPAPPGRASRSSGSNPIGGVSGSASVKTRQAAGAAPLESMSVDEDSGWTPARLAVVSGIALLVVGGIAAAVWNSGANQQDADQETQQKRPVAAMIERAREKAGKGRINDYKAMTTTQDSLESLRNGLRTFRTQNMHLPTDIREVATSDRVIMNFEKDADGYPLDGWGAAIGFDPETGDLRSPGLDGNYLSSDDLVLSIDGELTLPAAYERLEVTSE